MTIESATPDAVDAPHPRSKWARLVLRWLLALAMIGVGIDHFLNPTPFTRIVPNWLPAPEMLVYLSGVCEMVLGAALLVPKLRATAGLGLVALYLAVFPANINMALNHIQLDPTAPIPVWAMWARLPFQVLFIAWALYVRRDEARSLHPSSRR